MTFNVVCFTDECTIIGDLLTVCLAYQPCARLARRTLAQTTAAGAADYINNSDKATPTN